MHKIEDVLQCLLGCKVMCYGTLFICNETGDAGKLEECLRQRTI